MKERNTGDELSAYSLKKIPTLGSNVELCLCLVKSRAVWHSGGERRKGKWKEGRRGGWMDGGEVDGEVVVV